MNVKKLITGFSIALVLLLVLALPVFSKTAACFLAGTKISMADGSHKSIEDVRVGDKILSFDDDLNVRHMTVMELEAPISEDYYVFFMENGVKLNVTDEHPLYMSSGYYEGWGSLSPRKTLENLDILTQKIEVGDLLLTHDKEWVKILSILHVPEQVQTYNLKKVAGTHTFFASGFLAHNKGHGGGGGCPTLMRPSFCISPSTTVTVSRVLPMTFAKS